MPDMPPAIAEFNALLCPVTSTGVPLPVYRLAFPVGQALLNSNDRPHYRVRASITAQLRATAHLVAKTDPQLRRAMLAAKGQPVMQRAHILGVLCPPDDGLRDPANWYPSYKAAIDGLIDARVLADDDHTHVIGPDMRIGPIVPRGQMVLYVRQLPPVSALPPEVNP